VSDWRFFLINFGCVIDDFLSRPSTVSGIFFDSVFNISKTIRLELSTGKSVTPEFSVLFELSGLAATGKRDFAGSRVEAARV